MRITVRVPDDLGEEVKHRTDNVSAYVVEALTEKLRREKRDEARRELLRFAGTGIDDSLHDINQRERREGDRSFPAE
jgi:post-segregation antitoxin (ccd killing protein)